MSSVYSSSKSASSNSSTVDSTDETSSTWKRILHAICSAFFLTHTQPFHRLSVFVSIVEFIQLYTFCFTNYFSSFGTIEKPIEYLNLLREWGAGNLPTTLHQTISFFGLFFLLGVVILGGYIFWTVESGRQPERQVKKSFKATAFHVSCHVIRLLYLPLLHYFNDIIHCSENGGGFMEKETEFKAKCWGSAHVILSILFALASLALILVGFLVSLFSIEWIPSKESQMSVVNGRFSMLFWFCKTIAFLGAQYLSTLPSDFIKILAYGILLIILNLAMLVWMILYLPFHQPRTNLVTIILFTVSSLSAIIRTISALSSGSYSVFIAFVIIQVVGALVSMFLARKRIQRLYRMGVQPTSQDAETPHLPTFEKDFEVEIAARHGYYSEDEKQKEEAFGTFMKGVELFPHSVSIRLSHAIFMLSQMEDVQMLAVGIQRVQKMNPPLDFLFLLFCLETHRKNAMYLKDGGFQEISDSLRIAVKHQEKAKKCIRAFWGQLIKEQNLNSLRDIVVNIEHSEQRAEGIFQRLLRRFPKSPHLLRSYGQFCEDVKNDFEAAQESFRLADEMEEEKTKRNSKKKLKTSSFKFHETEKQNAMVNNYVEPKPPGSAYSSGSESEGGEPFAVSRNNSDSFTDSRLNQMGFTSTTQNAEKARARRRNMVLQRVYRERIENTKSNALKKLGIATKVSIGTLLLDILVLFIASIMVFNTWAFRFDQVATASRTREAFYFAANNARSAQLFAEEGNLEAIAMSTANVTKYANVAEDLRDYLNKAQVSAKSTSTIWKDPSVREFVFIENPPSRQELSTSLDDLLVRMIQSMRIIAAFDTANFLNADMNKDFRYLMDNAPRFFSDAMGKLTQAFLLNVQSAHAAYYLALEICIPLSVFLLVLVTVVFFYPAQLKIKRERSAALKLFVSIPKSILTNIYSSLSPEKDEDIPRDAEEEAYNDELAATAQVDVSSSKGMPIVRKLIMQYVGMIVICGGLVAALVIVGSTMKGLVDHLAPNMRYTRGEGFYALRLMFMGREYVLNDENTWEGGRDQLLEEFNSTINFYVAAHTALRHGSKVLGVDGGMDQPPVFRHYYFEYPCSFRDTNATCKGLEGLYVEMLANAYQLMNNPDSELTLNNTYLLNIMYMAPQVVALTDKMCGSIMDLKFENLTYYRRSLGLILAFCIPALIISYLVLRSSEINIKKEDERTMKMLLMIPADVIDNVAAIRDYLNGASVTSEKSEDVSADIVARNKSIVDGSVDAVIVIDQKGFIQVWNPAAVKLFGYMVEEAIGKNVSIIIPDEVAKHHDRYLAGYVSSRTSKIIGKTRQVIGKHKDGRTIPLSLSLSEGIIGEKMLFCGFLRDISDIMKFETELKDEKEKSQQLLYSFLPQYIATQLIQDQESGNRSMIAEAYKEVTVLFADIVGFTKLSSKVSPSELIHLLNRLFSKWDSLCETHKVEKIKTIGDCYMAACGVPERCVDHAQRTIEFAQDMLESLQDLNRETNSQLQLRIGINTGSVVAGVIGTRKMAYDLWGDAVNVASRMESSGVPGRIQVSQTTFEFLKTDYLFEERGRTEIKGKGTMLTYLLKARLFERTSSGHTKRRSAMTPVILKNLRSNTSTLKPTEPELTTPTEVELEIISQAASPVSQKEEQEEPQQQELSEEEDAKYDEGIPLSELVALEDEFVEKHVTLQEPEKDEDEEIESPKKSKIERVKTPYAPKSKLLPKKSTSSNDIERTKKLVRKNSSMPNANAESPKGRVKFV